MTKANSIQTILDRTYGANKEGFRPTNRILSEQIAKKLDAGVTDETESEVTLLLWDNYAGGDTAEATAKKILETV